MDPLYVLMSKSDHLQDLAMCVFGCVSFPSADPVLRCLYSLYLLFRPLSWDAQRHLPLSDPKSIMPMASSLHLFSFAYIC